MSNFSCHFHVTNNTSKPIIFSSDNIIDGNWHNIKLDPPSIIEPGTTYRFDLNDVGGTSKGAEGTAYFETISNGKKVKIGFYMTCPLIGKNKAEASLSPKDAPIIVGAKIENRSGHPANGYFTVNG